VFHDLLYVVQHHNEGNLKGNIHCDNT